MPLVLVALATVGACALFPSLSDLTSAPDAASDDAASEGSCDGGWIMCHGACVDPSSPADCNGCGNICTNGLCGNSVTAPLDAGVPALWGLNGKAVYEAVAGAVLLVPAHGQSVGSMIYVNPIAVDAFTVTFDVRTTIINGYRVDGMGFMLEQTGPAALGTTQGGGLGIAGLKGYGVELDVYDNGTCGDTSDNHIGVDDLTICSTAEGTPTSLFSTTSLGSADLADGQWHTVVIAYAQGAISVMRDGTTYVLGVAVPIEAGSPYYFGFGATVGGGAAPDGGLGGCTQEIRNISVSFPTSRCL